MLFKHIEGRENEIPNLFPTGYYFSCTVFRFLVHDNVVRVSGLFIATFQFLER